MRFAAVIASASAALLVCTMPTASAEMARVLPAAVPARVLVEPYAVIVHPSTKLADVSLAQLRRIFRGDQQFWPGGARVVLFVQTPGSPEREVMLRELYRMDETDFRRYWISKTFRDDVASGPKLVSSSAIARRLTASIPGAVAIIPLSAVDASVKVLRVDGKLPESDRYPLSTGGA